MDNEKQDQGAASEGTSESPCSVFDSLCDADKRCVDAAARAWVDAGGDQIGLSYTWQAIRERVRQLT